MAESWTSRKLRWRCNLFPAYRGTGARVTYIAADLREVRVRLPVSFRTRNYVGTIYGGSLYASVDPFFMLMLIRNLGPGYVVWDKAASIRFVRPGKTTLYASCRIDQAEIDWVRAESERVRSLDRVYRVNLVDAAGVLHAQVKKTVYVRRVSARTSQTSEIPSASGVVLAPPLAR